MKPATAVLRVFAVLFAFAGLGMALRYLMPPEQPVYALISAGAGIFACALVYTIAQVADRVLSR